MKNTIRVLSGITAVAFLCFALPAFGQDLVDPIVGVQATSGGQITNGGSPFSLTALENGTQSLQAVVGTNTSPFYEVENDAGKTSFALLFTGAIAFNQFLDCQENGSFSGSSCTTSGALGTKGNGQQYGPPPGLKNGDYWNPNATFTFSGLTIGGLSQCPDGTFNCFDITFASFGNGDMGQLGGQMSVPEGSGMPMFAASGLVLLGAMIFKRRFVV